jgi:hypothetical protein
MPVYGSIAPYAEPRESLRELKKDAKSSGAFPRVGKSSQENMFKKLEEINKGKQVSAVQQRRVALDNRLTYELETERMMGDLRRARMPGFRGQAARMMGVDRVAEQIA